MMNQGFGSTIPLCLSNDCEITPWHQDPWIMGGSGIAAVTAAGSAWLAWNWDDIISGWDSGEDLPTIEETP